MSLDEASDGSQRADRTKPIPRHSGHRDRLRERAAKGGLDRAAAHAWLASDVERDVVEGGDREARNAGISGVPFFIFNRAVGVSGAQDPQTLLDAMMQSLRGAAAAYESSPS